MAAPGTWCTEYGGGAALRAVPDAGGTGTAVGGYASSRWIFSRPGGRGADRRRVECGFQQWMGAARERRCADLLRFVGHAAARCQLDYGPAVGVRAAYSGRSLAKQSVRGTAFGPDPKKPGDSEVLLTGK